MLVREVEHAAIADLRDEYRRALGCQIVHDAWHRRGFTRCFQLSIDGAVAGHGAVGGPPGEPRDIVKEFHLRPEHRGHATALFRALVAASGARRIEAQTNDPLLLLMLHDHAEAIASDTILFADCLTTTLPPPIPGMRLRAVGEDEHPHVFVHTHEPIGEWGLELGGAIVATGGLAYHYNPPYGDLFMEVAGAHRRRGLGAYLVQALKRVCREGGHVPAARCHADNVASRRTLERAGMFPCARILSGRLRG